MDIKTINIIDEIMDEVTLRLSIGDYIDESVDDMDTLSQEDMDMDRLLDEIMKR
jgi:hypothetical protein